MSLVDHLRELRYRVIMSVLAVVLGAIVAALFNRQLFEILLMPYRQGVGLLAESKPGLDITVVNQGVTAPLMLWLKLSLVAGLVLSCPVWLFHLWRFLAPGLLAQEKKYAFGFLAAAVPLFLTGITLGYFLLPQGIAVLLAFTPESVPVSNLIDLPDFLDFLIKTMLAFGVGFLLPVVVVALNLVGGVKARQLAGVRSYIIFGTFVIGAVATPSADPFSMLALAIPLMLLYLVAELICHLHDRRQARRMATQ